MKVIDKPKKGSGKTRNRVHNVTEATDADLPCVRIACLRKGDGWANDRLVDMGGGSVQHRGITDSSGKKVTKLDKLFHSEWKLQVRKESYEAWLEKKTAMEPEKFYKIIYLCGTRVGEERSVQFKEWKKEIEDLDSPMKDLGVEEKSSWALS